MVADRPDFTDGTSVVAPGRFQFEMGYTFSKAGQGQEQDFGELLARVGILPWLEGRLGLNSFVLLREPAEDVDGLQDLTVGFKALLYRKPQGSSAAVPQLGLLFGLDLPTGAGDIGGTELQPGAKLAVDFALAGRLGVGTNIGWAYPSDEDGSYHAGLASMTVGYQISAPLIAYVEGYGLFPQDRGGGSDFYVDGGLVWKLGPNFQLDWRIGAGLQDPDPNWFTGAGLSFRL